MTERLIRGGLAPDAAEKAVDAMEVGDIHALNFAVTKSGAVVCPIPYELLVRCFPALAGVPMKGGKVDAEELRGMKLEYAINRHRGGTTASTRTSSPVPTRHGSTLPSRPSRVGG